MPSLAATIGAATLLLPLGGLGGVAAAPQAGVLEAPAARETIAPVAAKAGDAPKLPAVVKYPVSGQPAAIGSLKVTARQGQIRIEQRVYVRISPRSVSARRNMLARLPVQPRARRYEEKKSTKCVRVEQIAGVETGSGNRLLLFLRDAEILSVNLEKACRARDFYAGFYVERSDDGKLCVQRDTLQSRNGARCDIARIMKLKAIEE
ncbi:MAG: hypothetical protein AAF291_13355 [Pseudomonadota bacterium]